LTNDPAQVLADELHRLDKAAAGKLIDPARVTYCVVKYATDARGEDDAADDEETWGLHLAIPIAQVEELVEQRHAAMLLKLAMDLRDEKTPVWDGLHRSPIWLGGGQVHVIYYTFIKKRKA
jgi:hypothetical protein